MPRRRRKKTRRSRRDTNSDSLRHKILSKIGGDPRHRRILSKLRNINEKQEELNEKQGELIESMFRTS